MPYPAQDRLLDRRFYFDLQDPGRDRHLQWLRLVHASLLHPGSDPKQDESARASLRTGQRHARPCWGDQQPRRGHTYLWVIWKNVSIQEKIWIGSPSFQKNALICMVRLGSEGGTKGLPVDSLAVLLHGRHIKSTILQNEGISWRFRGADIDLHKISHRKTPPVQTSHSRRQLWWEEKSKNQKVALEYSNSAHLSIQNMPIRYIGGRLYGTKELYQSLQKRRSSIYSQARRYFDQALQPHSLHQTTSYLDATWTWFDRSCAITQVQSILIISCQWYRDSAEDITRSAISNFRHKYSNGW